MVSEFAVVFLDEVPGLPPAKEMKFAIDLVPITVPFSRVPYWMAPLGLMEFKTSL